MEIFLRSIASVQQPLQMHSNVEVSCCTVFYLVALWSRFVLGAMLLPTMMKAMTIIGRPFGKSCGESYTQ
jgi:hypothetical protein